MAPPKDPPAPAPDDDELDGCDVDFTEHADDEATSALRALYPGDVEVGDWNGVFDGAGH